jgi:hypothetical protein
VRLALKVVMQNEGDVLDVILLYVPTHLLYVALNYGKRHLCYNYDTED